MSEIEDDAPETWTLHRRGGRLRWLVVERIDEDRERLRRFETFTQATQYLTRNLLARNLLGLR